MKIKKQNINKIITFMALALFIASIPTQGFSKITGFSAKEDKVPSADTNIYSEMIYIVDSRCTDCYDATINEEILSKGYNVIPTGKRKVQYDSTEGKAIVEKYQITKIPTFITSSNASKSADLKSVWPQVGSVASDGTYVFRNVEIIGGNYETILSNGSVEFIEYIEPPVPNTTLGNFYISEEDLCTENGKPVVYLFGMTTCGYCRWEKPVIGNVTAKFADSIIYKELIDDFGEDESVFSKFNPSGGVPTLVFGCRYFRIGSGESLGAEEESRVLTALICDLINDTTSEQCSAVSDLIEQI